MVDLSRSVFYARCSSPQQAERDSTIAHYKSKATKVGFKLDQIFFEVGSGLSSERSNYQQIKSKVSQGLIDNIYLPDDLSRLTRDIGEFQLLKKLLQETGCKLYNLQHREYRFETPEESLQLNLQVSFYHFEAERNKYRAVMGHKFLRENGKAMRAVFPYVKKNGTLYPNNTEYKQSGKTLWEIGRELVKTYIEICTANKTLVVMTEKYGENKHGQKRWEDYCRSTRGLTKWLGCQLIRGNIEYHAADLIAYNTHEPLITPSEAKTLDKLLEIGNMGHSQKHEIFNLWKGIARCVCGAKMRTHLKKTTTKYGEYRYRWMICSEALPNNSNIIRKRKKGLEVAKCNRKSSYGLRIEHLEEMTIEALVSKSEDIANQQFSEPTLIVPKEVKTLQNQIKKYKVLAEEDKDLIPILNKKQLQLNQLLESSKANDGTELDYLRKSLATFGKNKDFWQQASQKEKIILFAEFIERIVIDKGNPTFYFKV